MVTSKNVHGVDRYIVRNDDSSILLLDEDDFQFIASSEDIDVIIYEYNRYADALYAEVIVSTKELGEALFIERFGPKQLILKLACCKNT